MRVRGETGRETEEMGKHRKREEQNKHITVNTDSSTKEQNKNKQVAHHSVLLCVLLLSFH